MFSAKQKTRKKVLCTILSPLLLNAGENGNSRQHSQKLNDHFPDVAWA